ncbi:hypothetical protein EB061_01980 [bacterium]|jgi:hypothetical protein|nr:hypothetical protein [bacterium]
MKKITICVLLIGVVLLTGAYHANGEAQPEIDSGASYRVGISAIHVNPEIGVPLAGYGDQKRRLRHWDWKDEVPHCFFFKPSIGVRDPIRAKAMIVETGKKRAIFVSVDVIGVADSLIEALLKGLRDRNVRREELIVSGTHTHSGPGTLSKNFALNAIAVDRFQKKNFDAMVNKILSVIESAFRNMEDADLYFTSFHAKNIQENKFRRSNQSWFNDEAGYILARSRKSGVWLGGLLNFAMHGNAMPIEDLRFSADMPGALERNSEKVLAELNYDRSRAPVVLFMNGAEGDVRHTGGRGEENMERVAADFGNQFRNRIQAQPLSLLPRELEISQRRMKLGIPAWPLKICAKRDGFYKRWMEILGRSGGIPMPGFFPTHTRLSMIRLGGILMMTWPGEASTSLGFELNSIAERYGFRKSWVLGLTNDYLAYFTTEHEFLEATYDSCSSLYSDHGGAKIVAHYRKQIEDLHR